jgi:hypothetical protein
LRSFDAVRVTVDLVLAAGFDGIEVGYIVGSEA